jgi:hypothetical protein
MGYMQLESMEKSMMGGNGMARRLDSVRRRLVKEVLA